MDHKLESPEKPEVLDDMTELEWMLLSPEEESELEDPFYPRVTPGDSPSRRLPKVTEKVTE